jgi:hypothetical protein
VKKASVFNGSVVLRRKPLLKYLLLLVRLREALGAFMLNRLTVSALLKIVLLATSLWVVIGIFAQCLGFLGTPAGGQPHRGDRGYVSLYVQGDA